MSLINSLNDEERKYIDVMSKIHVYTKKYLLLAEESAEAGECFLQPLKEHRDAYEHLMRCYIADIENDGSNEDELSQYIGNNLSKALGHEYRAFFDTADWFTYILRRWIRIKLSDEGEYICKNKILNYAEIKSFINELPYKIAKLRGNKDIGNVQENDDGLLPEINEYIKIMDKLIKIKREIVKKIGL